MNTLLYPRTYLFLILCFFFSLLMACAHKPSIRFASDLSKRDLNEAAAQPNPIQYQATERPTLLSNPVSTKTESTEAVLKYMDSLLGKPYAKLNGKSYRRDCSGTTRAIYDFFGINLGNSSSAGENDATTIYNEVKKNGVIDENNVAPLDLVFFDNTYDRNHNGKRDDKLTHVGVVEKILPDKTILFVHYMGRSIIRSRMNLQFPDLEHHPQTKERINHLIRRSSWRNKNLTAGKLFVGFGRFNLKDQTLSAVKSAPES